MKKIVLKGIIARAVYNQFPEIITFHPWCEVFLSDKWVICDSTLDKSLMNAVYKKGLIKKDEIPSIDWDGETDLNLLKFWMVEDHGPRSSLDELYEVLKKKGFSPDVTPPEIMNFSNKHTQRLRKKG